MPYLVAVCIAIGSAKYITSLRDEVKRLENNQSQLLTSNDKLAKERQSLTLNNGELKQFLSANESYAKMLHEDLKAKEKQVKSLTFQIAHMKIDTVISVRDSIIYVAGDSVPKVAKYSEFKDNYINANVLITDSAKWHISHKDTVAVTIIDRANFFQRLFGKNKINGAVTNKSPHSKIYLDKVIVKKK